MENCALMQEMISRMLDEQLSAEEQAALAEHLAVCPECRTMYQAFTAVSDTLRGDLAEPPEALRENVMAELRREQIRKRNLRPWRAVLSAAALAALMLGLRYGLPVAAPRATMTASARQFEDTGAEAKLYAASEESLQMNGAADLAESPEEEYEEAALAETADAAVKEESAVLAEAAPAAPQAVMESRSAAAAGGALADAALPVYDLSGKLALAELPGALHAETVELAPDRVGVPAGTVLAADGSLTLYEYEGELYFISPADGAPLRCGLSTAELESLAG